MSVLPPKWVRRAVFAPAVPVAAAMVVSTLPLTAMVAAFASPSLPGRWRPLRLLWFALVFLVAESVAIIWLFVLWLASGFGTRIRRERWQAAHYRLLRRYLAVLVHTGERTFNLRFDVDLVDAMPAGNPGPADGPLLVFSRHGGLGDSFLLVHALLQLGYRPHVVLKGTLRWSPLVDIFMHRLPMCIVVPKARVSARRRIVQLASGLGPGDALVLFPEGRNVTPKRRLRFIARLEASGDHEEAEQVRAMRHVFAPRPGGVVAGLGAAPSADVVFVAHTGLEGLYGIVDLWRGLPMDSSVKVKAWRVPSDDVPAGTRARTDWLLDWWRRIDDWVGTHQQERPD